MLIFKRIKFILLLAIISGCNKNVLDKRYQFYDPKIAEFLQNDDVITIPSDIRLRKDLSNHYYIKQSKDLPRPIPSLVPPGLKAQ